MTMRGESVMIHPTATVERRVVIRARTRVWHDTHLRENAVIGSECIIGKGVFIDSGVQIGNCVKIQNYACIYHGSVLEDGVFIGPHVILTNDRTPRAITPAGALKTAEDWRCDGVRICKGASLGAGAVVLPGVTIGRWAMIGAGAVVTRDVAPHALVVGNPAREIGSVCRCGVRRDCGAACCPMCGWHYSADEEEAGIAERDACLRANA